MSTVKRLRDRFAERQYDAVLQIRIAASSIGSLGYVTNNNLTQLQRAEADRQAANTMLNGVLARGDTITKHDVLEYAQHHLKNAGLNSDGSQARTWARAVRLIENNWEDI